MSDDPAHPRIDVYGSLDEIEADFGVRPDDLHRPTVDDLTRPNPDDPTGRSTMRRVPEVLDCWFESGSMPFAQVHYPFENKEWFDTHSPADFIVEYIAQTRGWFYTLHVLSVALFDRPAFRNVICHGVVLDAEGRKLSKKLRNERYSVIADLADDEKEMFLADMGLHEPGLNRLIRAGYKLLGLQTYFTAGVKEVRAWTIHQGDTAPQAAGVIHTDFERGFIRAQTIAYDDFIACGGEHGAKEAGKMRAEGKEYVVKDGDVMNFLFNV